MNELDKLRRENAELRRSLELAETNRQRDVFGSVLAGVGASDSANIPTVRDGVEHPQPLLGRTGMDRSLSFTQRDLY